MAGCRARSMFRRQARVRPGLTGGRPGAAPRSPPTCVARYGSPGTPGAQKARRPPTPPNGRRPLDYGVARRQPLPAATARQDASPPVEQPARGVGIEPTSAGTSWAQYNTPSGNVVNPTERRSSVRRPRTPTVTPSFRSAPERARRKRFSRRSRGAGRSSSSAARPSSSPRLRRLRCPQP